MNKRNSEFIEFVRYRDVLNWSVSHIVGSRLGFNANYPLVSIGSIITRSRNVVSVLDKTFYKQVTLKTKGGGAVLRDTKQGKDIGTKKQYCVSPGQFILSKIDARNGAFGVIGKELDGAIVTADFPVFDVKKDLVLPEYLSLLSSTSQFANFAQSCSRGTTNRQRIDIELFLSQMIPLPTLQEQERLVTSYNTKVNSADLLDEKALQVDLFIDNFFLKELDIRSSRSHASLSNSLCHLDFVRYKDIERWDICDSEDEVISSRFQTMTLSQLISSKPQYGANYRATGYDGKTRYVRITDINEDGSLNNEKVSASGYSERYLLKENDLLIARTGSVGKSFLYHESYGESIYAGYLIRFVLNSDVILPEFLLYYTKCSVYKKWISQNTRVSAQPNINSQQYLRSPIVLPPIDVQRSIVTFIEQKKAEIKALKQKAELLREQAIKEFELKIYS